MAGGKKNGKTSTSQVSVKSTSDETSTMSSELTKKKAFRAGHRNSTERKVESANETLNSLSEDPSSGSKQRATLMGVWKTRKSGIRKRKRNRNRKRNSNEGKLGNTETSFAVKSFSIYNHKSPKRNIRVCVGNYDGSIKSLYGN